MRGAGTKRVRPGGAMLLALVLGLGGCDTGGGGVDLDLRKAGLQELQLLATSPPAEAVQVPVDAPVRLDFDGPVHPDGLNEEEIRVEDEDGKAVPGTLSAENGGRTVRFDPAAPFAEARDYRIVVEPTLCDVDSRALDQRVERRFRTHDVEAPDVVRVDLGPAGMARRSGAWLLEFDERVDPGSLTTKSVRVVDGLDRTYPVDLTLTGRTLTLDLVQDLPGSRDLRLVLAGGEVRDVSGNALPEDLVHGLRTEPDTTPPVLVGSDPLSDAGGVSPRARLEYTFSESMAIDGLDGSALSILSEDGDDVGFTVSLSRDGRTVRLLPAEPLGTGKRYEVQFGSGPGAVTDASGNVLSVSHALPFRVGGDDAAPAVAELAPAHGSLDVSPNVSLELTLDEPLKPLSLRPGSVTLWHGTTEVPLRLTQVGDRGVLATPLEPLAPATQHALVVRGGYDGLQDLAGNPLPADVQAAFTTNADTVVPTFEVYPRAGAGAAPTSSRITAIANGPLTVSSVGTSSFQVLDEGGRPLSGSVAVTGGGRVIVFDPATVLPTATPITVRIAGGPDGVRLANGNWLAADVLHGFRTGLGADSGSAPKLELGLDGVRPDQAPGMRVPPSGFSIDVATYDPGDGAVDMSTLELSLSGPDVVPTPVELFKLLRFEGHSASLTLGEGWELPEGSYRLLARVADLSGNRSEIHEVGFEVGAPTFGSVPFERTQFVWTRFDTDRENGGQGDGLADFDEDLLALGLIADGDPMGLNAAMRRLVVDGVLAVANEAYGRSPEGNRRPGSANIRFLDRRPCGGQYMQIAVGGNDPQGPGGRGLGAESTGVIGRAWFDRRNSNPNDDVTATSPGLGVFSGELILYQARLHLDVKAYYLTTWARTYRGLSPFLGGTPVGRHVHDATVLGQGFDYAKATADQRARWDEIMRGADDLAATTGVILAHEVGHAVGLTAPGDLPGGLLGDSSLHNASHGLGEIMSAVIGYESMVTVGYGFRALNRAYLEHRLLLK